MKGLKILAPIGVAIFCVATAAAQNPPEHPPALAAGERFFPALNRVLTDAQRQSLRAALGSQRDKILSLEERLRASRRALLETAVGGSFSETSARPSAEAAAGAESELALIFARALSQMRPPLTPQQVQQLNNSQPGQFPPAAGAAAESEPETHLPLPPPLPRDTNDLPVVK